MRKINLRNFKVATSLTARDINRRIILNVVRALQPISRADVSRTTSLQRSTVSLIVDQLIDEGWVVEGEFGRLPRGRRPIYLQLNAARAGIVGINIRPETTTIALANLDGLFLEQEKFPTGRNDRAFVTELVRRTKALVDRHPQMTLEGIGVSVPGRVDRQTQRLALAPNLGWNDIDLKTPLEKATGLTVEIENAANACALAENYFGEEHDGVDNLVAVTVSEGIGTGIIVNGQLVRGATGLAGEFGHVTLNPDGPECRCGNYGCWETMASNRAALRYYAEAKGRAADPQVATFEELVELALSGQTRATEAISKMAVALGDGLALIIQGFEPSLVVIVGEVTLVWKLVEPIIQERLLAHKAEGRSTRILPIDNSLQPRLRGTVALVLEKHLGAPMVA